jgi:hypothetical protein
LAKLEWKFHEWEVVGFDSDVGAFASVWPGCDDVLDYISFCSRHCVV